MEPVIGTLLKEENISIISGLSIRLQAKIYLVGGCIRDLLLGKEVKDIDFALNGSVEEFACTFAQSVRGSFFWLDEERGQARVVRRDENSTMTFDFAPLRGVDIVADLELRDFTINALAVELGGRAEIIDPLDGRNDIRKRLVRMCSDSAFTDDPLRMLRAYRLAAVYDFQIDSATLEAIQRNAHLLVQVAAERTRDELFQILKAPGASRSLRNLLDSGLLEEIIPFGGVSQDELLGEEKSQFVVAGLEAIGRVEGLAREHPVDSSGEAEQLDVRLWREIQAGITVQSLMKLAAFILSVRVAPVDIAKRLKMGKAALRLLERFCLLEFDALEKQSDKLTPRAMYRFFSDHEPAGPELPLFATALGKMSEKLCRQLTTYYFQNYVPLERRLLLSGKEIMNILHIPPGKAVGEAMELLREAESTGTVNSSEEALEFISKNLLTNKEPIR